VTCSLAKGVDTLTTLMWRKYNLNVEDSELNEPGCASRGAQYFITYLFWVTFNVENTIVKTFFFSFK